MFALISDIHGDADERSLEPAGERFQRPAMVNPTFGEELPSALVSA